MTAEHHFSIALFREGNHKEFKHVFDLYYDTMFLFADNLIKADAEARDIATEGFIKLWKLHRNFESLPGIRSFLYITTRNACMDYLRFVQRQRTSKQEIRYLFDKDHWVENEMIDANVIHELSRRIEALPDRCREIFELIYYRNYTTSQIAEQLNITPQNVLNQKARGIKLLRSMLMKESLLQPAMVAILCMLLK